MSADSGTLEGAKLYLIDLNLLANIDLLNCDPKNSGVIFDLNVACYESRSSVSVSVI